MAVDLYDLIDPLKRDVNPPGIDLFPGSTDDDWAGRLADAFWDAHIHTELFDSYRANDDFAVEPITVGGDDLSRELQQLVVAYAAYRVIRTLLLNIKTSFRAQAGPVEFETQQSAQLLRDLLRDRQDDMKRIVDLISSQDVTPVYYFDAVIARDTSLRDGDTWWLGH